MVAPKRRAPDLAMRTLRSSTTRINGPMDPLPISNDVIVTKRFEVILDDTTAAVPVTPALLSSVFPGGTAGCFTRFRLVRLDAYGAASPNGDIKVLFLDDESSFTDKGTQGSMRPQLHLSPTFAMRNRWIASGETGPDSTLFIVSSTLANTSIVLQFTVEMRSTPDSLP